MQSGPMQMIGVRLPRETAEQLQRAAASERNASPLLRRLIAEGLTRLESQERRDD